jgi:hypothetical protein
MKKKSLVDEILKRGIKAGKVTIQMSKPEFDKQLQKALEGLQVQFCQNTNKVPIKEKRKTKRGKQ